MDNLKNYFLSLSGDEREAFAAKCKTSVAYIKQIYQGHRQCSASLAIEIDKNSKGFVKCDELCPSTDFDYLRSRKLLNATFKRPAGNKKPY